MMWPSVPRLKLVQNLNSLDNFFCFRIQMANKRARVEFDEGLIVLLSLFRQFDCY